MLLQAKISAVAEREAACAAKEDALKQQMEEQGAIAADLQVQARFLPVCCACTSAVIIYVPPLMQYFVPWKSCGNVLDSLSSGLCFLTFQMSVASNHLCKAHYDQVT